ANGEFFDEIGSPGGASKVGGYDFDHRVVTAVSAGANGHD
ncbi:ferredoxin, partial [Bacillus tequilensis]|nr:ferredoxin [Bacillus tequilensis]